jgi:hypothetical protein
MSNVAAPTILAISAGVPRGAVGAAIAAALTAAAIFLLVLARQRLRRTTLLGPWLWCLAGVGSLGLLETVFQCQTAAEEAQWLSAARFIAAALTLCPTVAVLGAKRPQDRAWNFVVLALWGIVSLPSLLSPALRGAILWVLILLPAINYLPTRFAWGALLVVLGEFILFAPRLPLVGRPLLATDPGLVSLACFAAAALVTARFCAKDRRQRHALDQLWLAFRDLFGLFWGLRVQERVNAAAKQFGWPLYLSWSGFRGADDHQLLDEIPAAYERALRQTLKGLLRRFATPQWIAAHLSEGVD